MEYVLIGLLVLVVAGWFVIKGQDDDDSVVPDVVEPPVTTTYTIADLQSMTKNELLEVASANGIDVRPSWSKARIMAEIIGGLGL